MSVPKEISHPDVFRIDVYRESPIWDHFEKWWMVPMPHLRELFVVRYEGDHEEREAIIAHVQNLHPGHVYVYN